MPKLVAPPPSLGPLTTRDDVGREAEALVLRYRLLKRLDGRGDLRGAPRDAALATEMVRQLVGGVDMAFAGTDAGWPICPGVRLERLVYSPWLDGCELPGSAFRLPETPTEFAKQFGERTGIGLADADQFQKVYRVTPLALGEVAMRVRDIEQAPWPTFRLLLSRHFDLIESNRLPDALAKPPKTAKWFERPAIDGFRLLAEVEREALIAADLALLARAGTPDEIRELLVDADEAETRERLRTSPELRRLLSYALVQTDAVAGFDTVTRLLGDAAAQHPSSWFTAAARGALKSETGDVAAMLGEKGSGFRQLLLEAFASPDGNRTNPLNNESASFWGFDNLLLSRIARIMLGGEFRGGTRGVPGDQSYDVLEDRSALAQIILRHVDPTTADTIERRSERQQIARSGESSPSLANIQKVANGYAKYMLPAAGTLGSAPRFSAARWNDRYVDKHFWRMIFGKDRRLFVQLNLSHDEAAALNNSLKRIRTVFEPVFGSHVADDVALRAACDLATGVSAISTNRRFTADLRKLLDILGKLGNTRPEDFRKARHRLRPGSEAFLKVRGRKGQPPTAKAKQRGTPRSERHATRRKQAAAVKTDASNDAGASIAGMIPTAPSQP